MASSVVKASNTGMAIRTGADARTSDRSRTWFPPAGRWADPSADRSADRRGQRRTPGRTRGDRSLSWSRRSGPGAHQLASPARRMKAGTRAARTRVASIDDGQREPDAEQLDEGDVGGGEGEEHDGERARPRGDDPARAFEPDGDRGVVVAGVVVLLLDAGRAGTPRSPSTARRRCRT